MMRILLETPEIVVLLKASIVLALGLIVARSFKRARAASRHAVMAATFCALALLPLALSLLPSVTIEIPVAGAAPRLASPVPTVVSAIELRPAAESQPVREVQPAQAVDTFATIARLVWGVGALIVLVSLVTGIARLEQLRRTGLPFTRAQPLVSELSLQLGIRRRVVVLAHERVVAPIAYGARSPAVFLPLDAAGWSEADLRRALTHELEHVRRRDWIVHIAARAVCALYWFHPLVWSSWRRLCVEAERACDDAVLRGSERTDYAEQLISLARRLTAAAPQPTLAMANRSDLSTRVTAILDATQSRGPLRAIAATTAIAASMLVVLAIAPLRAVGSQPNTSVIDVQRRDDCRGERQSRGLFRAAEKGRTRELAAAIAAGADVNCRLDGDGTPLIVAANAGQLDAVRLLLDSGADPNLASEGDGNPLIAAAGEGHLGVVQLLLDRGANIDRVVPGDENPLIQASGNGHLEVVRLLVARGADVNVRVWIEPTDWLPAGEWRTPLRMAQKDNNDGVTAFLIAAGARN